MQSAPKHRHDGTSPLPLGMDWSPPPRKWNGRETVWPHDPRTGWSYCVTIPSWVVRPKSRDSDPVVFYRVQVGIQSPEGITTTRGLLRRFNDFLKLSTLLKKAFPRKNLPAVPPKGLLRIKSRALLEERRCSLEEWMTKLLSDIDLSRSVAVASFLELEAAARSSFQDENQNNSEGNPSPGSSVSSLQVHPSSSLSILTGSSSIASDYGSDTAYETSEIGTPGCGRDNSSEGGIDNLPIDEDLTSPIERLVKYGMANIDEGLFMGHTILEKLEGLPRNTMRVSQMNGTTSKAAYIPDNRAEQSSEPAKDKVIGHARKLSGGSVESEASSLRGSELSNSGFRNSLPESLLDQLGKLEVSGNVDSELRASDVQLVLPFDQRDKLNRVLMTTQRRLMTAKTDMEDLVSRLNQEIAVKDYLATKVKDLEVELETTKQKSKEHLQQAILIERERVTQMQWDMEELRQKSFELEMKLKSQQDDNKFEKGTTDISPTQYNSLLKELNATKKQLEDLVERHEELQVKSKSDVKVLVKEVKALRSSQTELKKDLSESQKEKAEAQRLLQLEVQRKEAANAVRRKLFHECEVLLGRLQECSTSGLTDHVEKLALDSSSLSDALDLLVTSDNQIDLLTEVQVQLLAKESDDNDSVNEVHQFDEETRMMDDELRRLLREVFTENAKLRKQVNSALRRALKINTLSEKDEESGDSPSKNVQNTFTE